MPPTMIRLAFTILLAAGCSQTATVGTSRWVTTPKDSATKCTSICRDLGLGLDAVVVMASTVGCVCTAPAAAPAAPTTSARRSTTAGGLAALMIQAEEQERRQSD
jgi:hypothetical protein